jgi:hypothetical protein
MTMDFLRKIAAYLSFRRQVGVDGQKPPFNLRAMHTINKISIMMFLAALVFVALKWWVFN